MQKEKINNIDTMCFFPHDFEGTRRFFEDVWGFKVKNIRYSTENAGSEIHYIEYRFKDASIGLWNRKEIAGIVGEKTIEGVGCNFMTAVKLQRMEDIDEIYEEFTKRGVICICKPETFGFGSRAAYFLDHEKNIWEFYAWCDGADGPALVKRD